MDMHTSSLYECQWFPAAAVTHSLSWLLTGMAFPALLPMCVVKGAVQLVSELGCMTVDCSASALCKGVYYVLLL